MTEEEKKAVEFVKKRTKELKKYAKRENELVYDDIILNLIDKLQKESKELTKSNKTLNKIVDSMAKHIYISGDYACLYEECDDNMDRECEDCIKEYFYKKVKETKDNGSTRSV